jgi:hypothetical protein
LFSLAAATGLAIPAAVSAIEPAPLPVSATANPNQVLADSIAARLRGTDAVAGAQVSIIAQEGVVKLTGVVRDAGQKAALVSQVQAIAGVTLVQDALSTSEGVMQVQGQPPIAAPIPPQGGPIVEPAPVGMPGQITPDMQAPPLPPYAWPTYAPYNNASRIGYPQAYPYNAFPFIGPYYPFPKVPLGWRKVTLEWSDGHWYLGRNSAPHDYWRVKFQ